MNKVELSLIEQLNWTEFPPRLPQQPFFYPVTNIEYARQITVEWNVPAYGNGYVTQFDVDSEYLQRFNVETVGSSMHTEFWIPAEKLPEFNQHIVGLIKVVEAYESNY
ncbi:hypothetical protein ACAW74_11240 [Fibrella sp. WM1]|uniref:hypothetical protein n=1 Tax=Fibrella musci TaxID=3242485 RepID=UPI003522938B